MNVDKSTIKSKYYNVYCLGFFFKFDNIQPKDMLKSVWKGRLGDS